MHQLKLRLMKLTNILHLTNIMLCAPDLLKGNHTTKSWSWWIGRISGDVESFAYIARLVGSRAAQPEFASSRVFAVIFHVNWTRKPRQTVFVWACCGSFSTVRLRRVPASSRIWMIKDERSHWVTPAPTVADSFHPVGSCSSGSSLTCSWSQDTTTRRNCWEKLLWANRKHRKHRTWHRWSLQYCASLIYI